MIPLYSQYWSHYLDPGQFDHPATVVIHRRAIVVVVEGTCTRAHSREPDDHGCTSCLLHQFYSPEERAHDSFERIAKVAVLSSYLEQRAPTRMEPFSSTETRCDSLVVLECRQSCYNIAN
jgi:hypothetical protein